MYRHGVLLRVVGKSYFNSLLDIGTAIEQVLIEHDITLHASMGQKRYLKSND